MNFVFHYILYTHARAGMKARFCPLIAEGIEKKENKKEENIVCDLGYSARTKCISLTSKKTDDETMDDERRSPLFFFSRLRDWYQRTRAQSEMREVWKKGK